MTLTSLVAVQSNIHPGPNLPGQVRRAAIQDRRERINAALLSQSRATGEDFCCIKRKEGKPLPRLHNDCVAGKYQCFDGARRDAPAIRQAKMVGLRST